MHDLTTCWLKPWQELQREVPQGWLEHLYGCYSEPHRHYHNLRHLQDCFSHLQEVEGELASPSAVGLALWFHDAVYDTRQQSNEQASAELAEQCLLQAQVDKKTQRKVRNLILATRHHAQPSTTDEAWMVDIDLSILGASSDRFDEYDWQVRTEYGWVPEAQYRDGRRGLLASFLVRDRIFTTDYFHERFEDQARINLQRALRDLER